MAEENSNTTLLNCLDDEEDDIFSLSEFLTCRKASNGDEDPLLEDHSFEFFNTEEWNHNQTKINNSFQPENIIFCGNPIFTKKPIPENTQTPTRRKGVENSSSMQKFPSTMKSIENMKKGGGKRNNVMEHRVTILRASTRWHLYSFGMNKVPFEMEMNDIRSRQRRHWRRPDQSCSSNKLVGMRERVSVGCSNSTRRGGKGFWGLIREFGCNDYENTVVKASLVCIPKV